MQPLFLEPAYTEKTSSAEVTLPEDPAQWEQEILQEAYKQAPYIADFEPSVVMDRIIPEKLVGFGHIDVGNKSEAQGSPSGQEAQAAGIRYVRLPIIVRDGKLQPFDILVTDDSKMLPLTEKRLRQALFRPQMFDVTSRTPGDASIVSMLYPPSRMGQSFSNGGNMMGMMGSQGVKMASRGSLLQAVLPTITKEAYDRFLHSLHDPEVKAAAYKNAHAAQPSFRLLLEHNPEPKVAQREQKIANAISPTVVQVLKVAGRGYTVKTASHLAWAPTTREIDRGGLVRLLGEKLAQEVDEKGGVTIAEGSSVTEDQPESDKPVVIKDFGIYKVQDEKGQSLIGFVFPNLIDLDGHSMPTALFTNGSETAFQGEIAGVPVGSGASVLTGKPKGYGAFVTTLENGKMQATVPLRVHAAVGGEARESPGLLAEMMDGRQVTIQLQSGIVKPAMSEVGTCIMPASWKWMPLDDSGSTVLASSPEEFVTKTASALNQVQSVELRVSDGGAVSLSGLGVTKLAYDEVNMVDVPQALFVLGGLGVDPVYAMRKMGQSLYHKAPAQVKVARFIETLEGRREGAQKVAAAAMANFPEVRLLVKEAANVPDPTSVDTLLSLGFINPENLLTFVTYLPQLNETQAHLCELLVSARMGLREVPTYALERAIRSLEEVITGLEMLRFQNG